MKQKEQASKCTRDASLAGGWFTYNATLALNFYTFITLKKQLFEISIINITI